MKLSDFYYDLPEALIAQYPLKKRDEAKLLVIDRKKGTITHDVFKRIDQYLPTQSCFVLNDSKVIPARLLGIKEKTGAKVEVFVLNKVDDDCYQTLLRPLKRLNNGDKVIFADGKFSCEIVDWKQRLVRFDTKNLMATLRKIGHMPLPPYIKRPDEAMDKTFYQTVFAKTPGSVASPTAGLHFTLGLIKRLQRKGHTIKKVTLHIGTGTFKPVEEENITKHQMHEEDYKVTPLLYKSIQTLKKQGRKIVAVGTTSCRVLETLAKNKALEGSTNLFVYPGFKFEWTDILITNFHLPHSTLLMLVHAFGGPALLKRAYQEAIEKKYRFYSYGDAMMII
jgi:S-adenosylmethionine:tRNA ribosyltransferase-isomerase